uniref:DNA mismatch repair protein mutS, putative n=1 Tax=Arundo donax TaxID=35708 RepID=A0A0A8ZQJ9_ARUDO
MASDRYRTTGFCLPEWLASLLQ